MRGYSPSFPFVVCRARETDLTDSLNAAPKKKVEEKKILLGRPGNNLKVSRASDLPLSQ
jgi:hypothetical protein